MIDVASWMEYSAVSKKHRDGVTQRQNTVVASIENKYSEKLDLIVDVYIDPITERHMTMCIKEPNTTRDAMKQFINHPKNSNNMNCTRAVMNKKCVGLPERKAFKPSSSSQGKRTNPIEHSVTLHSNGTVRQHHRNAEQLVSETAMERSGSATKRAKHNDNIDHVVGVRTRIKDDNFITYPKKHDVEMVLKECRGLSQVLAPWEPTEQRTFVNVDKSGSESVSHQRSESVSHQKREYGWPSLDDVECALLGCRVTSDKWKGQFVERPLSPKGQVHDVHHFFTSVATGDTNVTADHQDQQNPSSFSAAEGEEAQPSDSSSVSSLSFPDQQQAIPPVLLRVTTSTILEEQELIWKQIQQDRQEHFNNHFHDYGNITTAWNHEITRSHRTRPPLSPQSHIYMHAANWVQSTTGITKDKDTCGPSSVTTSSVTIPWDASSVSSSSTPMKLRCSRPCMHSSISSPRMCAISPKPSSNQSKHRTSVCTSKFKENETGVSKHLVAACLGCQSQLTLPQGEASTVVYFSKCGTMATTKLMRSILRNDDSNKTNDHNPIPTTVTN